MRQLGGAEVSDRRRGADAATVPAATRSSSVSSPASVSCAARPADLGARSSVVDSVRDVIERRLARLSQPCARLLADGRPGRGRRASMGAAGKCTTNRDVSALVEEATSPADPRPPRPATVRFTHDLFREVIAAGLAVPSPAPGAASRLARRPALRGEESRATRPRRRAGPPCSRRPRRRATPTTLDAGPAATPARPPASRRCAWPSTMPRRTSNGRSIALDTTGARPGTSARDCSSRSPPRGMRPDDPRRRPRRSDEAWSLARAVRRPDRPSARGAGTARLSGPRPVRPSSATAQATMLASRRIAAIEPVDPSVLAATCEPPWPARSTTRWRRAGWIAPGRDRRRQRTAARAHRRPAIARQRPCVPSTTSSWSPGSARERLAVLDELERLVGPDDLQQFRLLRAQALLEAGRPGRSRPASARSATRRELYRASRGAVAGRLASERRWRCWPARLDEAVSRIDEAERHRGPDRRRRRPLGRRHSALGAGPVHRRPRLRAPPARLLGLANSA